jgi:hypothetical protein
VIKWSDKNQDMAGTQAAMVRATRRALHEAKLRGEPVPQWRDGKVVWVQADDVEIPVQPGTQPNSQ